MSRTSKMMVLAGTALSLGAMNALAQTANPDQDRAYAADVLADAQQRTSLLGVADAGHDGKGFMLSNADGSYTLYVGGQVQFRYTGNWTDDEGGSEDDSDDFAHGFETRRTKIWFKGNIINKDFTYNVVGAFDRGGNDSESSGSGGGFSLEQAWARYQWENGAWFKWGQFKLPFLREENVSSAHQLAADRSVTNEIFNQDYSQGLELGYSTDNFRITGNVSDGFGTDGFGTRNTTYTSGAEADYALTARAEWKWAGAWDQFNDFTSWRNSDRAGMLGGALHWQSGGETFATADVDMWSITGDVSLEFNGWNLYGAVVWRNTEPEGGTDADDWGWLVQGGVFFTDKTEGFARFDMVLPDDESGVPDDEYSTLTFGVNHYFLEKSHAAKFTADVQWFFDAQSESSSLVPSIEGIGMRSTSEDGQVTLRLQFQLLF